METTRNINVSNFQQQAQALICLRAFDTLCAKSKGRFHIVPLKGIDLMRSLYSDTLDRELHDIDLLVLPTERVIEFTDMLRQDGYQPEFAFALDPIALNAKKKVSMLSSSGNLPNIDVHMALITKKFFSATTNGFNEDTLLRVKAEDDVVCVLDDVDKWLFMATHLAFHFLTGDKWFRDLALLLDCFTAEKNKILVQRAKQYHLDRIVKAVLVQMEPLYPEIVDKMGLTQLLSDKNEKHFLRYVGYIVKHQRWLGKGPRLARYYWEFIFICDNKQRWCSFGRLLFPSLGNMQNIYRCYAISAIFLYIPHVIINIIGMVLFAIQYYTISCLKKEFSYD